jgi:membrane associated rhomboid family serine protease
MRCPECARQRTPVHTLRSMTTDPVVTYALIALNVLLFVGSTAGGSSFASGPRGSVAAKLDLYGPAVAAGDWWRLITSGFMHAGIAHILFNMYALFWIGRMLEPALGRARFLALYLASLLCGSLGVLLLNPHAVTVGASGAVFGLMGAAFVLQRLRGVSPMAGGIGPIILLTLGITFVIPGISIGGHLGGLAGGALIAFAMERLPSGRGRVAVAAPVVLAAVVGVAAFAAALAVAPAV